MQRRRCFRVTPHMFVLVLATASLANPNTAAAANDFAQPPPRMIEMLRRQHDPSDWLIVTTPTGTLELRTRDLGPDGLVAPTRTRAGAAPTTSIAWSEIERIELRHSRFRTGQWLGALSGSLVAFYAGAALNRSDRHTDVYAGWVAMPTGVLAGAIVGGRIGDRFAGARTLYPLEPVMPLAHADPSPIVIARVSSEDVLRVQGTFGEFSGRIETLDANGLGGLRPEARFDVGGALPAEPVPWSEVTRVERLGTASRHFAKVGALVGGGLLGAFGAGISAAVVGLSGSGSSASDVFGGLFIGGSLGALVGAGTGALIGSGVPRWHPVYAPRRSEGASASD